MEALLRTEIIRFISEHSGNRLIRDDGRYFDSPLIGFSSASDPLYEEYRSIIGAFHKLPDELLPGAATVVSWILPISAAVRISNRTQKEWPSRLWSETRSHGEAVNGDLRRHVVSWLESHGFSAVAPQYSPLWKELPETPAGIASTWSERHAAYAAGLGTFSLNDGFITPRGIAHRCGSVITTLTVAPSLRTARHHQQNCLFYRSSTCGACIRRCPVQAITTQGHDKYRCRQFVYGTVPEKLADTYGVPQLGCGLCQTLVPCESTIPPDRGHRDRVRDDAAIY